jgi:hypothetical protein
MPGGHKVWATVDCEKHGVRDCRGMLDKRVKVSIPLTKKQRREGGCPKCKAEATAQRRMQS